MCIVTAIKTILIVLIFKLVWYIDKSVWGNLITHSSVSYTMWLINTRMACHMIQHLFEPKYKIMKLKVMSLRF